MKKILIWLIALSLLRGAAYLFITPPWQAPDETTHFQFIELLSQRPLSEIRKIPLHGGDGHYFELERKILASMKKYKAWQYVGLPTPDPMPDCFFNTPFFVGSAPKIYRPPLYYLMGASLLKVFHPKDLETRLYVVRLYSLILALGTVIVSCLIGYLVFKDETYALMSGAFVSFLPQFMVIGTSVSSDNLVNLVSSIFLLYAIFLTGKERSTVSLVLLPLLSIVILLSGKTGLIALPAGILIFFLQIRKFKTLLSLSLFSPFVLILSCIGAEQFSPGIVQSVYTNLKMTLLESFSTLPKDWRFYLSFLSILFKSFWFVGGWMAIYWSRWLYAGLSLLSLCSFLGFLKILRDATKRRDNHPLPSNSILVLLISTVVTAFGASLVYYGFRGVLAQGRYLFPALSPIGILFILGLRSICPRSILRRLPGVFVGFLACMDLYALFGTILPYYLR